MGEGLAAPSPETPPSLSTLQASLHHPSFFSGTPVSFFFLKNYACGLFIVETASVSDCQSAHRAVTTSQSGYLASYMSAGSPGIGTPSCPWYISVRRGLRLNLTLFNFISPATLQATPGESAADTCYHVGVVRDGPHRRHSVTACSTQPRQRTILVSSSNTVSFEFAVRGLHVRPPDQEARFLVHYDGSRKFARYSLSGGYIYDSTAIRPPFNSHSTAFQPRLYDHLTTYVKTLLLCARP